MRVFKKLVIALVVFITSTVLFSGEAFAKPLDEIQDYNIRISMRQDGTMDITYHVEWKVLDSVSEGPLEWVKIGIPNNHVDEIKAKSSNISKIGYMNEGGSYVRIDLDKKYEAYEVVKLDFSIHQSYMYVIDDDNHICRYSFTPGWFDEIDVKHVKIMWKNDNVIKSNTNSEDDGYLIWESSLKAGERLNASVEYNLDVFDTNKDQQFEDDHKSSSNSQLITIIAIFVIVLIIVVVAGTGDDEYFYHSGFRGSGRYHTHYHHYTGSSVRKSCACASHCACACAGGGRAGCSVKDFYKMPEKEESESADEIGILLQVLEKESNN